MRERILVIEGDADLLRLFESILSVEGYACISARNLAEARERLAHEQPDLIVYDWSFTNNAGFAFLHELHGTAALAQVPVLVICDTHPSRSTLETLARLSIALIEKPFDLAHFCQYVATLVGTRERALGA
jgi:DNA-binding response OmpR family regulator